MDNFNNLYIPVRERIFTLLESKSIQQKDFAKTIEVSVSTITDWKKGKSFSFMKKLSSIAKALGASEAWLLTGKGAVWDDEGVPIMNKELFVQNVKRLCLEKNIKPTNACKESGVGGSFLSDINRGQTPSVEKVQKLAQYLGVTTSDLLGEEKPTPVAGDGLTPEFVQIFEQLSEEEKAFVVKQMKGLLAEE